MSTSAAGIRFAGIVPVWCDRARLQHGRLGNFFAAVTGAAAALTGLLFVVISLALPLVPQNIHLLGAEILVIAVPLFAVTLRNTVRYQRRNPDSPLYWSVSRMTSSAVAARGSCSSRSPA
jgi:hypothetical protein